MNQINSKTKLLTSKGCTRHDQFLPQLQFTGYGIKTKTMAMSLVFLEYKIQVYLSGVNRACAIVQANVCACFPVYDIYGNML